MSQIVRTNQSSVPKGLPSAFEQPLATALLSPNGLALLGSLCLLGVLYAVQGLWGSKSKLATARFGGRREKANARRQAVGQMKARKHNEVALYINTPTDKSDPKPIYLPDAQRGIAVAGAPGSGKTYSAIDPLIRSSLEQGFSTLIYDFKYPTQTSRHVAYALRLGYKVRIFAPGFPESDAVNPLDFLRGATDTSTARQLVEVWNKNTRLMAGGKEDRFFDNAGNLLTEGVLALAKSTKSPDLLMAQSILALPELGQRIAVAQTLNPWVRKSFDQLVSVKDSEKTQAGMVASAADLFSRFMKPNVLGAFWGKTTLPLDLEGKTLVIFGMDRERRDVVGALLAAILHMTIARNVSRPRRDPLVLAIDELPTLYLPNLVNWLNENREDGLISILGFQNLAQLEKTYGADLSRALFGACGTKFLFNPQENKSAQLFSEYLGQEEFLYRQKSRSRGKGGASTSTSYQRQVRKLFEPSRFLKLKTGECIAINPHFASRKEAYIPLRQRICILKSEIRKAATSLGLWEKVRQRLTERRPQRQPTAQDLEERTQLAESLLPLPAAGGQAEEFNRLAHRLEEML